MRILKISVLAILAFTLYSCGNNDGFAPSPESPATNPAAPGASDLAILPTAVNLAVNNTYVFTASGGDGTYTYSVVSGSGSILSTTGNYTASATAGSATVRVTDGQGHTADAIVTIKAALKISPSNVTLVWGSNATFSATGGVSPFTYSIESGVGSINSTTGKYTAPGSDGSAVVKVTDSLGNTSTANITVSNTLAITPATPVYVEVDGTLNFDATGGIPPYSFSCTNGTIGTAADGDYTAPPTAGSDTCKVTDNVGTQSSATVTIYNTLTLSPTDVTLAVGGTQQFTASGGYGALTYALVSGAGSIDASGLYTAPANATTAVIEVSDSIGNSLQANIEVVSSLTITPKNIYLPIGSTVNAYAAVLGTAPYTFSVDSGGGSINPSSGVYTASSTAGTGVVRVTDSLSTTDATNVYHITPVDIQNTWGNHFCALYSSSQYSNYKLKCWGNNSYGELGYEDINNRGDATSELGYGLKYVNVGTGKYVKKVAVGWYHTCAILDDDKVKCWGRNTYGQLGYGNTTQLGSAAGQMGDNLPYVDLGTGHTAKEIYAFGYHTCAILNDNTSKCWGRNTYGQLGQGSVVNLGSGADQMGDMLPAIDLGTGLYAVKFAGTEKTTCAILNNASVKCWGLGNNSIVTYYGELGLGTNNKSWGINPGEMGDALPTVNIGTGVTATDIAGGRYHYCVITNTGSVKCWGRSRYGELGYDMAQSSKLGDAAGQMGDSLATVNLGATATSLKLMMYASCATLTGGATKCWGYNKAGELLQNNITYYGCSGAGCASISTLSNMNFGSGRTVNKLAGGYYSACAILDDNKIKCWGARSCSSTSTTNSSKGCLLNGATTGGHLGDAPGENGDNLPYVNH